MTILVPCDGCKCLLLLPGWAWNVLIRNAVLAGAFVNFLRPPQACQREQSKNPQRP